MRTRVVVDPLTRIEGHLRVEAVVDNGVVVEARSSGTLYRGFEQILAGRDPLDAVQLTQRFCGVCPTAHAVASSQCLDHAFGIMPPDNGRIIRNLIQGANYIQSHVLHFYHLASLDFVRGPDVPPFVPRYEADYRLPKRTSDDIVNHYVQALHIRLKAHEMSAVFSGKMPHCASVVPGGVTVTPSVDKVTTFLWRLRELRDFIDNVYLPDVLAIAEVYRDYAEVGPGCRALLSYGAFDLDNVPDVTRRSRMFAMARYRDGRVDSVDPSLITEDVRYSWYRSPSHLRPAAGDTVPDPSKESAYSWLKAPRYDNDTYEVGPLARAVIARTSGQNTTYIKAIDSALAGLRLSPNHLFSVMGRHLARALETQVVANAMADWVLQIKLDQPVATAHVIPDEAHGYGLWDASRGALGHWIAIKNKRIERYQAVVPTTWNASPHDDRGQPGAMEQALVGAPVKDSENPFAVARIVRSFDPCIACAVHLVTPKRTLLQEIPLAAGRWLPHPTGP
ncbi:MAG TPA: nickel-dependent hydrogenase large subunit [Vicinamibacterales bacterium]|nr:nickel-dependent hydrogenase large subunit [Vicinamibacterales bacterium]